MLQNHIKYSQKTFQSFTGKERDSETGFSYFGARYYDSDLMTDFWFLFGYVVGCWLAVYSNLFRNTE